MIFFNLTFAFQYEAGLTLSSLSCFLSPDLARDLANDIMSLLTSTKPYLRYHSNSDSYKHLAIVKTLCQSQGFGSAFI
jgi:AP-3 complex subunit delta-1